jgi:hypothetical protein
LSTSYAKKFSGRRAHRIIKDIGHNLPQEAPQAFAEADARRDALRRLAEGIDVIMINHTIREKRTSSSDLEKTWVRLKKEPHS